LHDGRQPQHVGEQKTLNSLWSRTANEQSRKNPQFPA
jgi:hypothetical protein